jgi:hypothetical protein
VKRIDAIFNAESQGIVKSQKSEEKGDSLPPGCRLRFFQDKSLKGALILFLNKASEKA